MFIFLRISFRDHSPFLPFLFCRRPEETRLFFTASLCRLGETHGVAPFPTNKYFSFFQNMPRPAFLLSWKESFLNIFLFILLIQSVLRKIKTECSYCTYKTMIPETRIFYRFSTPSRSIIINIPYFQRSKGKFFTLTTKDYIWLCVRSLTDEKCLTEICKIAQIRKSLLCCFNKIKCKTFFSVVFF